MQYYTLTELCRAAGVSRAAFYKWQNEDLDFMELVDEHSISGKRGARKYDEQVLAFLRERSADSVAHVSDPQPDAPPQTVSEPQPDYHSLYIESLRDENARLRAELELRTVEAAELRTQNAQLLMLLAAEKSEKQNLLAAASEQPHRFMKRLASAFGKKEKP